MGVIEVVGATLKGRVAARRRLAAVAAGAVAVSLLAGIAEGQTVECGDEVRHDLRLTDDLGPCPAHGLVVAADGVTVDLNGHRIYADPLGEHNSAGVLVREVKAVTVRGGSVEGFDAGIVIRGGSGNLIVAITARDNVNRRKTDPCEYGDGIALFDTKNNRIEDNDVLRNGPYSGISLVGRSTGNVIGGNRLEDNNVPNYIAPGVPGTCGGNPGGPGMQLGRAIQAVGIRIEGPGASGNIVRGNTVVNSALAGIAVHGHVCNPPEDSGMEPQPANTGNLIARNVVRETGRDTVAVDAVADGIAILRQGPLGVVCSAHDNVVVRNRLIENFRHGIHLGATTSENVVSRNLARGNAGDGIRLDGPPSDSDFEGANGNVLVGNRGRGNGGYDGADYNEGCDQNRWRASRFGEVNRDCVRG